jgi:hypothetical protein
MKNANLYFTLLIITVYAVSSYPLLGRGRDRRSTCFTPEINDWTTKDLTMNNHVGQVDFKAKGTGLVFRLSSSQDMDDYQYSIALGPETTITRGDGTAICTFVQPYNADEEVRYSITYEPQGASIYLDIGEDNAWVCTDRFGWNAWGRSNYLGLTSFDVVEVCSFNAFVDTDRERKYRDNLSAFTAR